VAGDGASPMQVRLASLVENGFNAVERVAEYANLEEEAPKDIPGSKPDGWPDNGLVSPVFARLPTPDFSVSRLTKYVARSTCPK
jgi:hypothetical protein